MIYSEPPLKTGCLYWVVKSTINVTYDIFLGSTWLNSELDSSVEGIGFPKLREIEKSGDFKKHFKEKLKPFGLGSDVCCFYPINFSTSFCSKKLKKIQKLEHRKHLITPWNWNILNFFLLKLELTSLWISSEKSTRILGIILLHERCLKNTQVIEPLNGVMMTGLERVGWLTKWIYEVIIDKMEFVKMSP